MLACAAILASAVPALAESGVTAGTLRAAVTRLVSAELARDGATACAVLNAPLTGTARGQTCAQRWDARIARELAKPAGAARLRSDLRAIPTAAIVIVGEHATISLPHPLLDGHSRFYWTANCWMLTR